MDALAAVLPALVAGGPWALVVAGLYAILTGRLITRAAHEDRVGDLKDTIRLMDETIRTRDQQVSDLLAGARVSVKALNALREQAEIGSGDVAA